MRTELNTIVISNILEFIILLLIYFIYNKDKTKRIKYVLIQTAIFIGLIGIPYIQVQNYSQLRIFVILQTLYEMVASATIIYTIVKHFRKKNVKINLSKEEKILAMFSIIFGLILIIGMLITNYKYILPYDKYGNIENLYFNADVHRGVHTFINYDEIIPVANIHPLCRFVLMPIYFPIILSELIFGLESNIVASQYLIAYFVILIQCLMNAISVILLYKILGKINTDKKIKILASILFIFSESFIWLTIFPETYSVMLVMLLLTMYNYINKNKLWYVTGIMAIGTNVATIIPIGILVLCDFTKKIKKSSKKFLWTILGSIVALIFLIAFMFVCVPYVIAFMSNDLINIGDRAINSINKLFIPWLMGPNFQQNGIFFVETTSFNIIAIILLTIFTLTGIIGLTVNRHNIIVKTCTVQLLTGIALHVGLGYGINTAIIYSPLYVWSFIILIALGINYIIKKKEKAFIVFVCITIIMGGYNLIWYNKIRTQLKETEFETPQKIKRENTIFLRYSDGTNVQMRKVDNNLILVSTGETLLQRIDSELVINEKENYIVGNLEEKGQWFKIYIEDDKLKINICENIREIDIHKFFIFGMGMREKYILRLTDTSDTYQLIKYSNNQVILDNLKLQNIDYENYEVIAKNNGEVVKIYENEEGIYFQKGDETNVVDNSTKINIPKFDGYKHKKQLKILFNEIMVNILPDNGGITPNFMTYPTPWYRDGAIAAMALSKTGNIAQIEKWIENISSIYDNQNGEQEADNFGEVLYLQSLINNKNKKLINDILQEAENTKNEEGYLQGKTDGGEHPVYQTKWLIFGLKSLGLDYSKWKIPEINDTYASLTWFEQDDKKRVYKNEVIDDNYQYLKYARLHYYKIKTFGNMEVTYPMSYEQFGSKAIYTNIDAINVKHKNSHISVPHVWSAAEMFLYYVDLDEGKLK